MTKNNNDSRKSKLQSSDLSLRLDVDTLMKAVDVLLETNLYPIAKWNKLIERLRMYPGILFLAAAQILVALATEILDADSSPGVDPPQIA